MAAPAAEALHGLPRQYAETLVVDAGIGVPIRFVGGGEGLAPSVVVTYHPTRTTLAHQAANERPRGAGRLMAGAAPRAPATVGRAGQSSRPPAAGARRRPGHRMAGAGRLQAEALICSIPRRSARFGGGDAVHRLGDRGEAVAQAAGLVFTEGDVPLAVPRRR